MICPKCGRDIPQGTVCPCSFEAPGPILGAVPLSTNPAVNGIKRLGSSGLFLAIAILFSVSALFTILSSAAMGDVMMNLYYYGYSMGLDVEALGSLIDAMYSTSIPRAILGSIPTILLAVAMWIHYGTCRSTKSGNISTAGLTICKVLRYISMIGKCLVTVMLVIVGVILVLFFVSGGLDSISSSLYGGSSSFYSGSSVEEVALAIVMVLGIFILFFSFFMVLAITYQASIIRMINRTKISAQTGTPDNRVSGYLIAMNCIVAGLNILASFFALFTSPVSAVATLANAVGLILASVLLSRYRKEMDAVIYPPAVQVIPVEPMYGQPPMPGAQQVQQAPQYPDGSPVVEPPAPPQEPSEPPQA